MIFDNRSSLQELYGKYFDEQKIIEVPTVKDSIFYMIGEENPTVLDAGYIILKNGDFIKIYQSQDHDDVLSYFLTLYLELPFLKEYNSGAAAMEINRLGLPVYFGIKSKYLGEMESKGFVESYSQEITLSDLERKVGTFILSLPVSDDERVILTKEQKQAISKLMDSYEETCKKTNMPFDVFIGNIEKDLSLSEKKVQEILSEGKQL